MLKQLKLWRLPAVLLLIFAGLDLWIGPAEVDWSDFGQDPVAQLRLLRMLGAVVVGAALATAGLIFQAVLRNPLAEPFTLGISGGAGVGAALAFILGLRMWSIYAVPLCAFAGAVTVLALVVLFTRRMNRDNLLLSGVIAGTVASSILVYLLSIADTRELAGVTWWLLGDLQTVNSKLLLITGSGTAAGVVFCSCAGRELNALSLGDEAAWDLGVNYRRWTLILTALASLLAAGTVALAGVIAFAGLIVPHIVRKCYGCDHRRIGVLTALYGGAFMVLCDLLSRMMDPAREIPIGVLTSLVGGCVFICILNRRNGSNL